MFGLKAFLKNSSYQIDKLNTNEEKVFPIVKVTQTAKGSKSNFGMNPYCSSGIK